MEKNTLKQAHGFHINDMHSFDVNPILGLMALVTIPVLALGLVLYFSG